MKLGGNSCGRDKGRIGGGVGITGEPDPNIEMSPVWTFRVRNERDKRVILNLQSSI